MFNNIVKYWTIILAIGSAVCYFIGYVKAARLFDVLSLMTIPTDVYSRFNIFLSGLTFFVTALSAPLVMLITMVLVNYVISVCKKEIIVNIFCKSRRIMFLGLVIASFILFQFAYIIPSGLMGIPWLFTFNSVWFYTIFIVVMLFLLAYTSFELTKNRTDLNRRVAFGVVIFIWMSSMLSSELYALRFIKSFPISMITQHPGITGTLITKEKIENSKSSLEFKDGYASKGILLTKNDKLYYFVVFPKGTVSQMYILPEEKVIAFQTIININDYYNDLK